MKLTKLRISHVLVSLSLAFSLSACGAETTGVCLGPQPALSPTGPLLLSVGSEQELTVTWLGGLCGDQPPALQWSTDDPGVVEVAATSDSTAVVRGIAPGEAVVTVATDPDVGELSWLFR